MPVSIAPARAAVRAATNHALPLVALLAFASGASALELPAEVPAAETLVRDDPANQCESDRPKVVLDIDRLARCVLRPAEPPCGCLR